MMNGSWTYFQEGLFDPVVLDHAVPAQVRDQFRIRRARAAPSHACGCCECLGVTPE